MPPTHRKRVRHFNEPGHMHLLTFSCYRRLPLLTRDDRQRLLCQAIDRATARHGYRLFAFVLMPEHVHLLVHPRTGGGDIAALLRAIKRPYSFRIKQLLEKAAAADQPQARELLRRLTIRQRPGVATFRFWQEGPGHDGNLFSPRRILAAIDYIHMNPVRRGLCERCIDWKWSSARYHLLEREQSDPDLPRLTPLPPDLLN
jgi:putative transposase